MLVRRHRLLAHGVLALVFLTGAAHFVLHRYLRHEGAFGPEASPAEPWALKLHGGLAMATLVLVGSLLGPHILRFWRVRRNRAMGVGFSAATLLLIASGYALYYAGDEQAREWARVGHVAIGFLALPVFLAHLVRGRQVIRRRRPRD